MRTSKYSVEDLRNAVAINFSYAGVLRTLGIKQAGGSQANIKYRIHAIGIDISHFTGQSHQRDRGCNSGNKKTTDQVLVLLPPGSRKTKVTQLRRALTELGVDERCVYCGLGTMWNGLPIRLEIDHINGEWLDNRRENLQYLCPNCHYQKTWVEPKNRGNP